jgi:sulfur-oxidizing protein SoxZ
MVARVQIPKEAKRGEIVEIRIVIQHPMETGYRRDDVGRPIKRNVINAFSCKFNGAQIFRADMSSGISANPYLQFYTVAEASGEFEFYWIDDEGSQGLERQSIVVSG